MNGLSESRWISSYQPAPDPQVRLLCFPHAGSSAAAYGSWSGLLPPQIDVCPIEYPGRGSRRAERPFVRVPALVASLVSGLAPALTAPFGVFGHSMGALIGFEFVRQLRRLGLPSPIGLFIAGCRAPSLPASKPPVFALSDDDLLKELQSLNGTPDEILMNPEFVRLFMPTLRADFELADTYCYRRGAGLECPVFVYGGADDRETRPDELPGWASETNGPLALRTYPGDHFFLERAESAVMRDLAADVLSVC
jgi:surfactin synthase thioesterase subunit